MKPSTRRLGRGLGAFLDFGPAGDDGRTQVSDVISSESATSVIETSGPAATRVPAPPPVARAPVVAAARALAPTQSTLPLRAPAQAPSPALAPAPRPVAAPLLASERPVVAPAPAPAPAAAQPEPVDDDCAFVDDIVVGLTFPDVELD